MKKCGIEQVRYRTGLLAFILIGSLLSVAFGPATLTESDFALCPVFPHQISMMAPGTPPQLSATASILMEGHSGTVLYASNAHQRLPPASTTKLVTALVALQRANLGDRVTVQASDLTVGSSMGLAAGEELTMEDLLYGLLLPSDNAAAVVIARYVAGSESAFVQLMNDLVAEMGLQDTHFMNPHGLDEVNHFSSAYDLAQIARKVLAHPVLSQMVATREKWAASRLLTNRNQLLGQYSGAIGVKTGTTDAAGECLIAAVKRGDDLVIAVVLGSEDRYADARELLDYYFRRFCQVRLYLEQNALARLADTEGHSLMLQTDFEGSVLLPRWQVEMLHPYRLIQTESPTPQPGNPVGKLVFYLCNSIIAELPLSIGGYY